MITTEKELSEHYSDVSESCEMITAEKELSEHYSDISESSSYSHQKDIEKIDMTISRAYKIIFELTKLKNKLLREPHLTLVE